jgi:hypothetical protein
LKDCARFLADAWAQVSERTIRHCWSHAGIVPPEFIAEMKLLDVADDTGMWITDLQKSVKELREIANDQLNENEVKADDYVDVDQYEV